MKIEWLPPLAPNEPAPNLGDHRIARLERLIKNFAHLHGRRPLHGTLVHDRGLVIGVQLENEPEVVDITTPLPVSGQREQQKGRCDSNGLKGNIE